MRSESEIKTLITNLALQDERIRAVLLNGSRANPTIQPDKWQDFDLVFMVRRLETFISDHSWTNIFGDKLIWQLPDEMDLGNQNRSIGFGYLMLFNDGNRIDLTLFPVEQVENNFKMDSLTIVWIDKDHLFSKIPPASEADYYIEKPTERAFLETCNEFWWVSTYVAKGLARNQILYAKHLLETVVRPLLMKLIEWKIGGENAFLVSVGSAGKFIERYLNKDFYAQVLQTYSDANKENNWQSLFRMAELFSQLSDELSIKWRFAPNKNEQENTFTYLRKVYTEEKDVR